MNQISKKMSKRICAILLALSMVGSSLITTLIPKKEAEASTGSSNVVVLNNFDETDVTYTNTEGWFSEAVTYTVKRNSDSELCMEHAQWVEEKGVNGTAAAKFWQIRGSSTSHGDTNISYVRLYGTTDSGYCLFTPEVNTTYTISLKIKAVVSSKQINVQLRNAASDGTIAYNDTVVATLASNLSASENAGWTKIKATFTTGDTVASMYVALTSHDGWWSKESEVYVDDIAVLKGTETLYTPSDKIINDFDETDVTYNNKETWVSNAVSYEVRRDTNSELCAEHAQWVEGKGVNGTAAAKFWQIRASSTKHDDTAVSYIRLYDTADNDYRLFTPEKNETYTVSLKIKAVVSSKQINVQLRNAASDGAIAYNDTVAATLASNLEATENADWQSFTAVFTTGDTVTPLYVALTSHDGWWSSVSEVYVDDIIVTKGIEKTYTPSNKIVNDFEETDVTYNNKETWVSNAVSYEVRRDTNSELCAEYASVEEKAGVDGTKAARFWQIRGSSGNDNAVSYIRLYDTADNDYRLFMPETNAAYTITLKIKAVKSNKNIAVQLRNAAANGTVSYKDTTIAGLNNVSIVISEDAEWQELTATFTTGSAVAPLYVALVATDGWWAKEAEVYVDDIVVTRVQAVTCYNYCADGAQDKILTLEADSTYAELPIPTMSGAKFKGYYADAAYTTLVNAETSIGDTSKLWVKWNFWGNVTEDTENEIDICDLVRLKKLTATEKYTEAADLVEDSVLDAEDLTEMRNILLDTKITFSLFADFHYKEGMYMSSIEDLNAIFKRASENKVDFVLHMGDFCNDYLGSPELMSAYLNNKYDLEVYGIYGNHELETENNSMQVVTPNLTNCSDNVVWGTEDGKIGDGSIGYYYFDRGDLRVVCTDTQYSYMTDTEKWVHNPTGSSGESGIYGSSLGPVQLSWLETVLTAAANSGKKCIVLSHATFNANWVDASPDATAVAAIYARVNEVKAGTVMMSLNGHYHTNRMQVVDNVFYFDVNTVRNGYWANAGSDHYTSEQTFQYVSYDETGNVISSSDKALGTLSQGRNTYFFENPLNAIVTISPYTGQIEINGMESDWIYDVDPNLNDGKTMPRIYNSLISLGK